jgi:hypothetical protein
MSNHNIYYADTMNGYADITPGTEIYFKANNESSTPENITDKKKLLGTSGLKKLIYNTRAEISTYEQNVKDYVDSIVVNIDTSSTSTRTIVDTLFSNTNILSEFAEQTITIKNLSDYDEIYVECASDTGVESIGIARNSIVLDYTDNALYAIYATFFYNGVVTQLFRGIKISGNDITITDCEYTQGTTISKANNYMVPTKIIGTKYNEKEQQNGIVTIDGIKLPALPDVDFPYAYICYHRAGYYYLQYSREPYYADYWKTNSTIANPYYRNPDSLVYYDLNDGKIFRLPEKEVGVASVWLDYSEEQKIALLGYSNEYSRAVWSNYDIYFNYPENTIAFEKTV